MTPLETALGHFANTGRCFTTDCILHSRTGRVIITPDLFVMARPVVSAWPEEWIVNPAINVVEGEHGALIPEPDCIHIHLLIGSIEEALAYARQRKQFGQLIGEFQALQHRAAHLYSEV